MLADVEGKRKRPSDRPMFLLLVSLMFWYLFILRVATRIVALKMAKGGNA